MNSLAVILLLVLFSGCGIKGPPLSPEKEETIQSQKNWDNVENTTQPKPAVPKIKKVLKRKNKSTNEN
ncbi:MAG: lipoprotein [Bdellovibrionaceae bacterium]|nr:lipoprotein [Bdellovibrio sp.]